jgi:hypothetical protein
MMNLINVLKLENFNTRTFSHAPQYFIVFKTKNARLVSPNERFLR